MRLCALIKWLGLWLQHPFSQTSSQARLDRFDLTTDLHPPNSLHDCAITVSTGRGHLARAFRGCATGRSEVDGNMDNQVAQSGYWACEYFPYLKD